MRQGFAVFAGTSPDVVRASVREAETLGYDSFWVNYPGSIDGLTVLASAARETQEIELGVGVIPLQTREPESIADGVRDTALPLGRLLLGVGSPNPGSLSRVRAGVAVLRARLDTRLVVAALGPRMCRLAGEVADGVLLNWLTPDHARRSAEWVREGAAAAGRPVPRLATYVRVALGESARGRLRTEGGRYATIPAYADHFKRMGVDPVDTAVAADRPEDVRTALRAWEGAVDEVIVRAITAHETVEEHLALVRAARPA